MKNRKLKSPNDYPLFGFRVKPETKGELSDLLDDLHSSYNKSISKGERKYKKNELFERALKIGLSQLKRKNN